MQVSGLLIVIKRFAEEAVWCTSSCLACNQHGVSLRESSLSLFFVAACVCLYSERTFWKRASNYRMSVTNVLMQQLKRPVCLLSHMQSSRSLTCRSSLMGAVPAWHATWRSSRIRSDSRQVLHSRAHRPKRKMGGSQACEGLGQVHSYVFALARAADYLSLFYPSSYLSL